MNALFLLCSMSITSYTTNHKINNKKKTQNKYSVGSHMNAFAIKILFKRKLFMIAKTPKFMFMCVCAQLVAS